MNLLTLGMLIFVVLISIIVFSYASCYMAGDLRKTSFLGNLCAVTASVICLVLANNLLIAFIGWQGISYFIYQLLTHYKDRPQAIAAAKHKCKITRIGDASFLIAIILSYSTLHSSEYSQLAQSSQAGFIAFLLAFAVITKASLFPFHTWLPKTLETPTPVSALMHAGVINAGGFLLIRLFSLISQHLWVLIFLTLIGCLTAVVGSLYTMVQPSIKKKLAYSTVSQMGFMFFQYGLGSPLSALFHLFSHGLYKATAFLDSGNGLRQGYAKEAPYSALLSLKKTAVALLGTGVILMIADHYFDLRSIPLLSLGFVSLSLFQWLLNAPENSWHHMTFTYLFALFLTAEYAVATHIFEHYFSLGAITWLPVDAQRTLLAALWTIQLAASLFPIRLIQKTQTARCLYRLLKEHRYA